MKDMGGQGKAKGTREEREFLPQESYKLVGQCIHMKMFGNNSGCLWLKARMNWKRVSFCCYLVSKSCPTLCDPTDCSPPGSSVCRILQGRILEWVAIPFSRGSSQPRDRTRVSCIGRWILYHWATREPMFLLDMVHQVRSPWDSYWNRVQCRTPRVSG